MRVRSTSYAPMAAARVATLGHPINSFDGSARFLESDASLVFADISGFTALSERLAKKGRIGAELVNQLLSISFSAMLDVALSLGGDLISFGGDALCLLFDGEGHPERAVAAAHGLRSSLRRTASLRAPIDRGTLKISTGIHTGSVVLALVGKRTPMLITLGPTLTKTLRLEGLANGGEVLVSDEVQERLIRSGSSWVVTAPHSAGVHSIVSLRQKAMPWFTAPRPEAKAVSSTFGCDPAVEAELTSGRSGLEHRQATISFIHYEGIDHMLDRDGTASTVAAVHRLMTEVQTAAEAEGVTVLSTDVDKDGGKIVLAAGIPLSAGLEHDRLLSVVYRLQKADNALPLRIGVNAGRVFVGPVGSAERSTYTIIGDAVNTTARIMAKAEEGQVLVAPSVLRGGPHAVEFGGNHTLSSQGEVDVPAGERARSPSVTGRKVGHSDATPVPRPRRRNRRD